MAVMSTEEIYRFALLAGFTPDQAVTMTAIALAESSGDTGAHNPNGEDSRGLWQINARSHPEFDGQDLYDPLTNAKAAFSVSDGGRDISPWTTTHGIGDAAYLNHEHEAELAARMAGDTAHGNWTGVEGYGHPATAAGSGATGHATALDLTRSTTGSTSTDLTGHGSTTADLATTAIPAPVDHAHAASLTHPDSTTSTALATFLRSAEAQVGDQYVWGVTDSISNPNPTAFDCSELVKWAAGRAGLSFDDGTWLQYLDLKGQGKTVSVDEAIHTPGALLFRFSSEPVPGGGRPSQAHVAISLGDGRTVEAASTETGVMYGNANNGFNYAGVLPGISDGTGGPATSVSTVPVATAPVAMVTAADAGLDSDHDGITDAMEAKLGLDPHNADTDHDGLSDGYELTRSKTNPLRADTDKDGIADAVEVSTGTDPLSPDSNHDGMVDGATGPMVDSDHDGLSDHLEAILGTDPHQADSDHDGFTDGSEYFGGFNPLSADNSPLAGVGADTHLDGLHL